MMEWHATLMTRAAAVPFWKGFNHLGREKRGQSLGQPESISSNTKASIEIHSKPCLLVRAHSRKLPKPDQRHAASAEGSAQDISRFACEAPCILEVTRSPLGIVDIPGSEQEAPNLPLGLT